MRQGEFSEEVVDGADHRPFGLHLLDSPQEGYKPSEFSLCHPVPGNWVAIEAHGLFMDA
jgi:hypothetical protein